jgi:3-hydroxyisobutyrate dehydrogenase
MAVIGFIGLGNMGAPMAANLAKAGHRVVGYDINASAAKALAATGVEAAASASDAARGADIVITMLPAGEHVRDVWLHQGGLIEAVKGSTPLLIEDCVAF